jgi:hypothetical protein
MMSEIAPDRKDLLRAHNPQHRIRRQLALKPPSVSEKIKKSRARKKAEKETDPVEPSVFDKLLANPSPDGRRATIGHYQSARRVVCRLYGIDRDQLRMNFRLKKIHPLLVDELYSVTGKIFLVWAGMSIEELVRYSEGKE